MDGCPAPHGVSDRRARDSSDGALVRAVDTHLVPGVTALQPGHGVHPPRDGDAPDVGGERLAAAVEQVLLLARQPDIQQRETLGAGIAVALPERVRPPVGAAGFRSPRWPCFVGFVC